MLLLRGDLDAYRGVKQILEKYNKHNNSNPPWGVAPEALTHPEILQTI